MSSSPAEVPPFDAVLIVSFGAPEKSEDVIPFLENVLRGKNVPRQRLLEVAHHYEALGGKSPLNDQNRALCANLQAELDAHGPRLPVYWGNRNWHPLLADTLSQMAGDGIRRALALVTSAYSSYSSCRQYLENIAEAQKRVGRQAPRVEKLRVFYNHPGFIAPMVDRVLAALAEIPLERREPAAVVFTAHSIPLAMAAGCRYEEELLEASRLVMAHLAAAGEPERLWRLAYQSRSGPPEQLWLGPDVEEVLVELAGLPVRDVVIVPIGFLSDHVEILYDLDIEAAARCRQLGLNMVRAQTVGTHPQFVQMIRELILERTAGAPRPALGRFGPGHDVCPPDCCPSGRPPRPAGA